MTRPTAAPNIAPRPHAFCNNNNADYARNKLYKLLREGGAAPTPPPFHPAVINPMPGTRAATAPRRIAFIPFGSIFVRRQTFSAVHSCEHNIGHSLSAAAVAAVAVYEATRPRDSAGCVRSGRMTINFHISTDPDACLTRQPVCPEYIDAFMLGQHSSARAIETPRERDRESEREKDVDASITQCQRHTANARRRTAAGF